MRVAIIGAGVAGASAAWHLARAGARPVVIDPSRDGRATAAGAGIVAPWAGSSATDPDWHRRGAAAARDYPAMIAALAEDGESDTGFSNCGALFVAEDRAVLDRVARDLLARRNEAPEMGEISVLDPSQARAAFPPLHPALSAVHIGGGARVDGRRLAASFRRAAVRRGAGELHGAATLVHSAGGVSVRVDGEPVAADTILVAAGAWSAELLAPLGITLKVAPQRGQIVHLRAGPALAALTASWPSVLPDAGSGHYLVAFEAGRLVAGATRETGSGFAYDLTAEGQLRVLTEALRLASGLGAMAVIEWRVGFRPLSADGLPILGPVPGFSNLFLATGFGGTGLTVGPLSGKLLAQAILGQPVSLDIAPYAPLR